MLDIYNMINTPSTKMFSVHISVLSRVELHKKLKKSIRLVTLVDQLNQFIFATSKTSVQYT